MLNLLLLDFHMHVFLSDKRCPPVPDLTHADASSMQASVGTKITYTCHEGYQFSDRYKTSVLECGSTLEWIGTNHGCQCECLGYTLLTQKDKLEAGDLDSPGD